MNKNSKYRNNLRLNDNSYTSNYSAFFETFDHLMIENEYFSFNRDELQKEIDRKRLEKNLNDD